MAYTNTMLQKEAEDMFYKRSETGYKSPMEGVDMKALVYGEKTMLCEFRIKAGNTVPAHDHPHEQTGFLIKGKMRFIIGEEEFEAEPGDCWCISGGVSHSAQVLEDSIIVEVFSPPREEYL